MLSGAHQPDTGTILLNCEQITIAGPRDATERGIAVIYQEFNLIPQLSVAENLFLGREKTKGTLSPAPKKTARPKRFSSVSPRRLTPRRPSGS